MSHTIALNQRLAELREILTLREPSPETWETLCVALQPWSDGELDDIGLTYLGEHLRSWPPQLRVAPRAWLSRWFKTGHEPRLGLARHIKYTGALDWNVLDLMCRARWFASIVSLELRACHLDDDQVTLLAHSPHLATIKHLSLFSNRVGDRGVRALVRSKQLRGMESLDLSQNRVGDVGVRELTRATTLDRLETLLLAQNRLRSQAGVWLSGAQRLATTLKRLDLSHNTALEHKGVWNLLSTRVLRLEALGLAALPVEDEGVRLLTHCRSLESLRVLDLHGCGLTDAAVSVLTGAFHLRRLRSVALGGNRLTDKSAHLLAQWSKGAQMERLDLRGCRTQTRSGLTDRGVAVLAASEGMAHLTHLDLRGNQLTDEAAFALARSPHLGQLRALHLIDWGRTGNRVGAAGVRALAQSMTLPEPVRLRFAELERGLRDALHPPRRA